MELILAVAKLGLRLLYLPFKLFPTQNKVVMLSRESDTEPIDFALIREELERRAPETRVVSFCRKQTKKTNPFTYGIFLFRSLYHIATASVAVPMVRSGSFIVRESSTSSRCSPRSLRCLMVLRLPTV